jgi:hypothetical protein
MKKIAPYLFLILVPLSFAHAQTVIGIMNKILDLIIRPLINLMLVAATLVFIWGVVEYIAKSDNEEARSTGRRHMMWGIIGLAIMVSAAAFVPIMENFWNSVK